MKDLALLVYSAVCFFSAVFFFSVFTVIGQRERMDNQKEIINQQKHEAELLKIRIQVLELKLKTDSVKQ